MIRLKHAAFLVAIIPAMAAAQRDTAATRFVVKTIPLHHLTSAEAMKLLQPYVRTGGGGVYDVPNVRAVTIRETAAVSSEMLAVLAKYDHEPATITLNFELVAGYSCDACAPPLDARTSPPAGLDSLMRRMLKYRQYRVLATTVATSDENNIVSLALSAEGDPMRLEVHVRDVRVDESQPVIVVDGVRQESAPASVYLYIKLWRDAIGVQGQTPGRPPSQLFESGVTVPIGQTVVLGSAVTTLPPGAVRDKRFTPSGRGRGESTDGALILVVRPQINPVKR